MARRSKNSNQGMHDTKACYTPGCKLYDARVWPCCSIPYCVVHQEPKYHTHADRDRVVWCLEDFQDDPNERQFLGMPVKKAIKARKAAAKAARKTL